VSKQSAGKSAPVKKVSGPNIAKAIERWTADIWQLHSGRPAPTVNYAGNMPDIDVLLQEWPPEMEALLGESNDDIYFFPDYLQWIFMVLAK
jgi:hypothetical protein